MSSYRQTLAEQLAAIAAAAPANEPFADIRLRMMTETRPADTAYENIWMGELSKALRRLRLTRRDQTPPPQALFGTEA